MKPKRTLLTFNSFDNGTVIASRKSINIGLIFLVLIGIHADSHFSCCGSSVFGHETGLHIESGNCGHSPKSIITRFKIEKDLLIDDPCIPHTAHADVDDFDDAFKRKIKKRERKKPLYQLQATDELYYCPLTQLESSGLSIEKKERIYNERLAILSRVEENARPSKIKRRDRSRIHSGMTGHIGDFPWFVTILVDGSGQCNGILISNQHILTAAHCFLPEDSNPKIKIWKFSVNAIVARTEMARNLWHLKGVKTRKASEVCISDKVWQSREDEFGDVAVLRLDRPIRQQKNFTSPICFPSRRVTRKDDCFALGTGLLYSFREDDEKQASLIQILPVRYQKCIFEQTKDRTRICFMAASRKYMGDTCSGDSGGPIVCRMSRNSTSNYGEPRWEVHGLTSFGRDGCYKQEFISPSINYDIQANIREIKKLIRMCS